MALTILNFLHFHYSAEAKYQAHILFTASRQYFP